MTTFDFTSPSADRQESDCEDTWGLVRHVCEVCNPGVACKHSLWVEMNLNLTGLID